MGRFDFLRGGLRLNMGGGDGDGDGDKEDDDERDDGVVPVGLSVYFPSIYSSSMGQVSHLYPKDVALGVAEAGRSRGGARKTRGVDG